MSSRQILTGVKLNYETRTKVRPWMYAKYGEHFSPPIRE